MPSIRLLILMICVFISNQYANADERFFSDIEITATAATAGSYGEHWHLHLTRSGVGYLQYFSSVPQGSIMGNFFIETEALTRIESEARARGFDKLSKRIGPKFFPLHAPHYSLSIRAGSAEYDVQVYDPKSPGQSAELDQFWSVWNDVWMLVPIRPQSVPGASSPSVQRINPGRQSVDLTR